MAGFEPTDDRVRAGCLAVWLHPNVCNTGGNFFRIRQYYECGFESLLALSDWYPQQDSDLRLTA